MMICLICGLQYCLSTNVSAAPPKGTYLLQDEFNREEKDDSQEQVGNDWGTNSKSRAQGVKQVDLVDGTLHITRADVADHGVSLTHEAAFKDAVINLRFKLGPQDDLGINIADMKEKSVHAGHICMAKIHPKRVELVDLKTGRMNLETRTRRLADQATPEDKQRIKNTVKYFPYETSKNEWHHLQVQVIGDTLTMLIDGKEVGSFQSSGIGHPTKSRLRIAVNREAWIDDVEVIKLK